MAAGVPPSPAAETLRPRAACVQKGPSRVCTRFPPPVRQPLCLRNAAKVQPLPARAWRAVLRRCFLSATSCGARVYGVFDCGVGSARGTRLCPCRGKGSRVLCCSDAGDVWEGWELLN